MTWREMYRKMNDDVLEVQRKNWGKVARAVARAIASYDKSKQEGKNGLSGMDQG